MKSLLNRVWREDEGILTFEWILLLTILVIGVTGALSAVRDALLTELGDIAFAMSAVDQSYSVQAPMDFGVGTEIHPDGGFGFAFQDAVNLEEGRTSDGGPVVVAQESGLPSDIGDRDAETAVTAN